MSKENQSLLFPAMVRLVAGLMLLLTTFMSRAQTPVQRAGFLKTATVNGKTYVCNVNGVPFSMAGVDLYWSNWDIKFYTKSTVDYFVDNWKISVIRCAVGVAYTPAENGHVTTAVPGGIIQDYTTNFNKCTTIIDQAIARGIYVIVDWHIEGKASNYTETAKKFFKEIAEKYSAYPNIIYEVYNEPAYDGNNQSEINAYNQLMVDYIRQYDKKNIIICGSNTWSQNPQAVNITGANAYNIAYTFHAYPDNYSGHLDAFNSNVETAQKSGKAVFITELSGKGSSYSNTAYIMEKAKEWNIPVTTWEAIDNGEDWSIFCSGQGTSCLTSLGTMFKEKMLAWPLIPPSEVVHPTAIAFSPNVVTLPYIGASAQTTLAFTPSSTTDQSATYVSSNPTIVSVDASGKITARASGDATITATANDKTNGNIQAACAVTVKNLSNVALGKPAIASSSESVTYDASKAVDGSSTTRWSSTFNDPQYIQVDLGASYKISLVSLNWEAASAKSYMVQTSPDGSANSWTTIYTTTTGDGGVDELAVNGVGRFIRMYGEARNTAYGYSLFEFGVYGEPDAVVDVTGVTLTPPTASLFVGATTALTASVQPANATNKNVLWSSSNTAIATVSASGVVTGVAEGTATITVTTQQGGHLAHSQITVSRKPVTGISIVCPTNPSIGIGSTLTITASVVPADATNKGIAWSSSNLAAATVSSSGVVTGVAEGSAIIRATSVDGGFIGECNITVTRVQNLVTNGDFTSGLSQWSTYVDAAASASITASSGKAYANITNGGWNVWHVQFYQGNISIVNGKSYQLTFDAYATSNRSIAAVVEKASSPYTQYGGGTVDITTTVTTYTLTFIMNQPSDANARLAFNVGNSNAKVYIDNVVLTVSSGQGFSQKIEAESYNEMAGVQTESTSDTGGGLNVGWIDTGDWMKYKSITIPTTGSYIFEYRVSSPTGGTLSQDLNSGAIQLGSVTIPNTGGWQNWQTVSKTFNLNAGTYDFGIFAQTGGWNINWWRILSTTGGRIASSQVSGSVEKDEMSIYPNPAESFVIITVKKPSRVQVIDASGGLHFDALVDQEVTLNQLKPGFYIVRKMNDSGVATGKLIVR